MPPKWQVKDSGHSARSAEGRLHLNRHTPLAKRSRSGLIMLSRHSVGTYQGNELTRKMSGNARPQSSQLVEPLWTDPGLKRRNGARELIFTLKKKKLGWGMIHRTYPKVFAREKEEREKKNEPWNCVRSECPLERETSFG